MKQIIKGIGEVDIRENSEVVKNPFSGESCELEPEAVAIYDLAKGAEILGQYKLLRKCLDYFMRKWPAEYMKLLD